jgi:type I restriction enzyme, S subunit
MTADLPEGWGTIRVADYFSSWGGMTPSTSNASYWGGSVPWVSSQDIKAWRIAGGKEFITRKALQETRLRLCPASSVLVVVRSGILAHTLPIAVVDTPVSINQDLKAFYSPDSKLNEWLALALRALAPEILTNNRKDGTTVQSIRYDELCDLIIHVPPSDEQRRITARLGELLEKVRSTTERLSRIPAILKRFRQAVLAAACSGRLTSQDVVPEGELPLNWHRRRIDSLFSVRTGGTPSRKVKEYFVKGSIPWVKTGELRNTDITSVEEYITPRAVEESNAKVFPIDTILIAMYGEGKTRGQIGRLTFPAATNQACAALVNTKLPSEAQNYIFIYLLSQYETLRAEAVGGNQPNLNLSIIKEWEVPLPPADEQRKIVERVKALLSLTDAIEQRVSAATLRANKLTQSILAKAFRSELVPTEAELARREGREYEPASVLLERIKEERTREPKSAKRGRKSVLTAASR